jgi:hypothetical protein
MLAGDARGAARRLVGRRRAGVGHLDQLGRQHLRSGDGRPTQKGPPSLVGFLPFQPFLPFWQLVLAAHTPPPMIVLNGSSLEGCVTA